MSEVKVDKGEQTEERIDQERREALTRLAKYTAPAMLAVLMSTTAEPRTRQPRLSDIRLKRDIAQVGELDSGVGLYRYRYLWSETIYVGVMAQEVAAVTCPKRFSAGRTGTCALIIRAPRPAHADLGRQSARMAASPPPEPQIMSLAQRILARLRDWP